MNLLSDIRRPQNQNSKIGPKIITSILPCFISIFWKRKQISLLKKLILDCNWTRPPIPFASWRLCTFQHYANNDKFESHFLGLRFFNQISQSAIKIPNKRSIYHITWKLLDSIQFHISSSTFIHKIVMRKGNSKFLLCQVFFADDDNEYIHITQRRCFASLVIKSSFTF